MVKVQLTANLQKYYPQAQFEMDANSVLDLLSKMDLVQKQFSTYILEDDKSVRKHVNIFIDGKLLPKTETKTALKNGSTVHIMQALSGG
ncbi:MAG: MoaD/ThiS family protein [Pseudobdellovibrionaceae bacterium]